MSATDTVLLELELTRTEFGKSEAATASDQTGLSSGAAPRRRVGITCYELDGEAILYDVAHHAMHYLNSTALFIFQLCNGQRSIENMATVLAVRHALDLEDVHVRAHVLDDVRHTLTELMNNGLIDSGCEPSP